MTPEQQKIALLEKQVQELRKAVGVLTRRLVEADKKASAAYNNAYNNKVNIHRLKEHLNQGH